MSLILFTDLFSRLDCPRCQVNRLSIRLNFYRKRRFEPLILRFVVMLLLFYHSLSQILLQSVRQENAKLGAISSAEFSSALDSAVKICNV